MGPTALLPFLRKSCCGILSPSAGFQPANIMSTDKHANHQTTEHDVWYITRYLKKIPKDKCVASHITDLGGHTFRKNVVTEKFFQHFSCRMYYMHCVLSCWDQQSCFSTFRRKIASLLLLVMFSVVFSLRGSITWLCESPLHTPAVNSVLRNVDSLSTSSYSVWLLTSTDRTSWHTCFIFRRTSIQISAHHLSWLDFIMVFLTPTRQILRYACQ
jgi:hypothetical protein